jgi:uncharacterized protein YnzC (UPF0291/DUF896 family)
LISLLQPTVPANFAFLFDRIAEPCFEAAQKLADAPCVVWRRFTGITLINTNFYQRMELSCSAKNPHSTTESEKAHVAALLDDFLDRRKTRGRKLRPDQVATRPPASSVTYPRISNNDWSYYRTNDEGNLRKTERGENRPRLSDVWEDVPPARHRYDGEPVRFDAKDPWLDHLFSVNGKSRSECIPANAYTINVNKRGNLDRLRDEFFEPTKEEVSRWLKKYSEVLEDGSRVFKEPPIPRFQQRQFSRSFKNVVSEDTIARGFRRFVSFAEREDEDSVDFMSKDPVDSIEPDSGRLDTFIEDEFEQDADFAGSINAPEAEHSIEATSHVSRNVSHYYHTREVDGVSYVVYDSPVNREVLAQRVLDKMRRISDELDNKARCADGQTQLSDSNVPCSLTSTKNKVPDLGRASFFKFNYLRAKKTGRVIPMVLILAESRPSKSLRREWEDKLRDAGKYEAENICLLDEVGNSILDDNGKQVMVRRGIGFRYYELERVNKGEFDIPSCRPLDTIRETTKTQPTPSPSVETEFISDNIDEKWRQALNNSFDPQGNDFQDGLYMLLERQVPRLYCLATADELLFGEHGEVFMEGTGDIHDGAFAFYRQRFAAKSAFATKSLIGPMKVLTAVGTFVTDVQISCLPPEHRIRSKQSEILTLSMQLIE